MESSVWHAHRRLLVVRACCMVCRQMKITTTNAYLHETVQLVNLWSIAIASVWFESLAIHTNAHCVFIIAVVAQQEYVGELNGSVEKHVDSTTVSWTDHSVTTYSHVIAVAILTTYEMNAMGYNFKNFCRKIE